MLRPAGCSSGRGDCARGGWAAGRCVPVGMFCARFTPAVRFCWNVLRSITPAVRFCWNVLRSDHAGRAVLSECPAFDYACLAVLSRCPVFDHACCLPHSAKQDGLRGVPFLFPPWVEIAGRAFSSVVRLSDFMGSLRACAFSGGDPDGGRRDEGTERRGERSRRQGVRALLRNHISTDMFSAGSTLGLRAPDCAGAPRPRLRQRVFDSLDSLLLIRGVGAFHAARAFENNKGLSFVPTSRSTRVHGETCPSPIYARASRAVQR